MSADDAVRADDDSLITSSEPTDAVLWLFATLCLGAATVQLLSLSKRQWFAAFFQCFPYTVVVFIIGACLALYVKYDRRGRGEPDFFATSMLDWLRIDPDLLLFIFVPPLVFGEAMQTNVFHLRKAAGQSFLLAVPGVAIGAALMAVFTKLILPPHYHWGWLFCGLFGATLSATDTVAVLSLLHSAAASAKLTICIVGESLANDATSMILFTFFLELLRGRSALATPSGLTIFLLKTVLGSPCLGLVFGALAYLWLRACRRPLHDDDMTVQIAITLCCSYLSFFFAQYVCEISGILTVCTAGLVLAWLAPPIILNPHNMEIVWGFMTWVANTLLFALSGLIIGHRVLESVQYIDFLYVVVLYALLQIVRVASVALLYPWLSKWGHGCTTKEALFVSFAGLRGSLSMVLALLVSEDCGDVSQEERSRFFFFVGGVASLTLVVNGGLAKFVLDALDLVNANSVERALMLERVKRRLALKVDSAVDKLGAEMGLQPAALEEVRAALSLLRQQDRSDDDDDDDIHSFIIAHASDEGSSTRSSGGVLQLGISEGDEKGDDEVGGGRERGVSASAVDRGGGVGGKNRGAGGDSSNTSGQPLQHGRFRSVDINFRFRHHSVATKGQGWPRTTSTSMRLPSRAQSRAQRVSSVCRLLEHTSVIARTERQGGAEAVVLIPDLLEFVRTLFLDIVRSQYWDLIAQSKLPRASYAVRFLLYSIDVGLDAVAEETRAPQVQKRRAGDAVDYTADFAVVLSELRAEPARISVLKLFEAMGASCWGVLDRVLAAHEARKDKRMCYVLGAFIDAHTAAAKKLDSYLMSESSSGDVTLPEAVVVKKESARSVAMAMEMMREIPQKTVLQVRIKQCTLSVLQRESILIKQCVKERLLTHSDSDVLMDEVLADKLAVERDRINRWGRERHARAGGIIGAAAQAEPLLPWEQQNN